jgi:magnesium-transporting ATPase (P-type)
MKDNSVDLPAAPATNQETGLTTEEARNRFQQFGPNEVPEQKTHPVLRFLKKFWGVSAWMIELIGLLSLILHKFADFWVALLLLLVNAVLSYVQEQRAAAAVTALRLQLIVLARVLRDGTWTSLPARELVKGDIVRVRAGDFIPADLLVGHLATGSA